MLHDFYLDPSLGKFICTGTYPYFIALICPQRDLITLLSMHHAWHAAVRWKLIIIDSYLCVLNYSPSKFMMFANHSQILFAAKIKTA
jgi:hypothetical protein